MKANYTKWFETYNVYLEEMFYMIDNKIYNITFENFCRFIYKHSSGYISQYV